MIYIRFKLLLVIIGAILAVPSQTVAETIIGKTQTAQAKPQVTPGMAAAAAAQQKCVELIKAQPAFDKNIANYNTTSKELEAKLKSLPQPVSTGGSQERCAMQKEQIANFQSMIQEHYAYLDNIAQAIKFCPAQMTEKLSSAQLALKKSLETLEKVMIATEGVHASSCK